MPWGSEFVSSQVFKEPSVIWGGGGSKINQVTQNVMKHVFVLDLWKSDEIGENV